MTDHALHTFSAGLFDDAAEHRAVIAGKFRRRLADFAMIGFVLAIAALQLASMTFHGSVEANLDASPAITSP